MERSVERKERGCDAQTAPSGADSVSVQSTENTEFL